MPLRDHFHPPIENKFRWVGVHITWPAMIVRMLADILPSRFVAEPGAHSGPRIEIGLDTYESDSPHLIAVNRGTATAVWTATRPTLSVTTDLAEQDEFEVLIHDMRRARHLVAAVEIVSPANKDRPESRRAFVAKCSDCSRNTSPSRSSIS